jgi:hypothetical protein
MYTRFIPRGAETPSTHVQINLLPTKRSLDIVGDVPRELFP